MPHFAISWYFFDGSHWALGEIFHYRDNREKERIGISVCGLRTSQEVKSIAVSACGLSLACNQCL